MLPSSCRPLHNLVLGLLLSTAGASSARSAVIVVDAGGECTLAEAIDSANQDDAGGSGCTSGETGLDTIQLDADVTLTSAHFNPPILESRAGLPIVWSEIAIVAGLGDTIERADLPCSGPDAFRLLNVDYSGQLTLEGITLRNGCVSNAGFACGGAIAVFADGPSFQPPTLTLVDASFEDNEVIATGIDQIAGGGAVCVLHGTVAEITRTTFSGNGVEGTAPGSDAQGGALYLDNSTIDSVSLSVFTGNTASGSSVAPDGGEARGGAWYLLDSEVTAVERTLFSDNQAVGGDSSSGAGGLASGGAISGSGGVIHSFVDGLFRGNEALGGDGTFAGPAQGGAAHMRFAFLQHTTFQDNHALAGAADASQANAIGGGLYHSPVSTSDIVVGNTFVGNIVRGGGNGGQADGGGAASGPVVFPGPFYELNSFVGNEARSLGVEAARGGGLYAQGPLRINNNLGGDNRVIVFDMSWPEGDCDGNGLSGGYNFFESSGCETSSSDLSGPAVAWPVGDYGCAATLLDGTCPPMAPLDTGGLAIDRGNCAITASNATEDARGVARPTDLPTFGNVEDACDIGAIEATDVDGDGDAEPFDNCAAVSNSSQADDDDDGVGNVCDNCVLDANPGQEDGDGDDRGDLCDGCIGEDLSGDFDLDGFCSDADNCPFHVNPSQEDADADTIGDLCDACFGANASGDDDEDAFCADEDCDDLDAAVAAVCEATGWDLYTTTPCRLLDTRDGLALASGVDRVLDVDGSVCGIPATAKAVALNITLIGGAGGGHLTAYPFGLPLPNTSTVNFAAGQTRANSAVVGLGGDGNGWIAFRAAVAGGGEVHLVVDVVGWFE
jgi:hypothetical protein